MAILTKAALRTAIDAVFASGMKITAEQARGEFHDWIDSLLAPASIVNGAGITVSTDSAGAVTIAAGGAAAAVGLPSFLAATAAQPSDGVLTATIAGVTNSPPFPSLVYLLTPNGLDRSADDLELRINGDTSRVRSLVDFRGDPLKARDYGPGRALRDSRARQPGRGVSRLTEPIPVRLPDWDVVFAWSDRTSDAGRSRFGNGVAVSGRSSRSRTIHWKPAPASLAWLGVPNDGTSDPELGAAWFRRPVRQHLSSTRGPCHGGLSMGERIILGSPYRV